LAGRLAQRGCPEGLRSGSALLSPVGLMRVFAAGMPDGDAVEVEGIGGRWSRVGSDLPCRVAGAGRLPVNRPLRVLEEIGWGGVAAGTDAGFARGTSVVMPGPLFDLSVDHTIVVGTLLVMHRPVNIAGVYQVDLPVAQWSVVAKTWSDKTFNRGSARQRCCRSVGIPSSDRQGPSHSILSGCSSIYIYARARPSNSLPANPFPCIARCQPR
jgi:hypothetical protein